MKFIKQSYLWCFIFLHSSIIANFSQDEPTINRENYSTSILWEEKEATPSMLTEYWKKSKHQCKKKKRGFRSECCHLGKAGFAGGPAEWYVIDTAPFPNVSLLSQNRIRGSTQGNVALTPTGLRIDEPGNYSASIDVVLLNNDPEYTPITPIFLVLNDTFDSINPTSNPGSVVTLPYGFIISASGTGILENVPAGTNLSIVITNSGSPEPEPVTVLGWSISVFKIPCKPQ